MARARKKSYNDVDNQWNRIWLGLVRSSDAYQNSKRRHPDADDTTHFQNADMRLRREDNLSEKDKIINNRINRAAKTTGRYKQNLLKGSGFSDVTPYYERNKERLDAYYKWEKKKYGLARRAGISG